MSSSETSFLFKFFVDLLIDLLVALDFLDLLYINWSATSLGITLLGLYFSNHWASSGILIGAFNPTDLDLQSCRIDLNWSFLCHCFQDFEKQQNSNTFCVVERWSWIEKSWKFSLWPPTWYVIRKGRLEPTTILDRI